MTKFFIILTDSDGNIDWRHPSELNGSSKQEVFNLIAQNVPRENICDVLTAAEYDAKYLTKSSKGKNNKNVVQQDLLDLSSDQFENGNDFFNAMLTAGTQFGENNLENIEVQTKSNSKKKQNNKNVEQTENFQEEQNSIPQYFEEGGIKFKLENGKLYKKVWKQILLNGQITPDGGEAVSEFRLVSASTKKLISVEKVELQHLEWEEVKTH